MLAFGVGLTGLSVAFSRWDLAGGIVIGTTIAFLNFRAWKWFGKRLIRRQEGEKPQLLMGLMTAKNLLPFLLIGLAVGFLGVHPVGLSLGLSSLIAAIFFYAFWLTLKILWQRDKDEHGSQ